MHPGGQVDGVPRWVHALPPLAKKQRPHSTASLHRTGQTETESSLTFSRWSIVFSDSLDK